MANEAPHINALRLLVEELERSTFVDVSLAAPALDAVRTAARAALRRARFNDKLARARKDNGNG